MIKVFVYGTLMKGEVNAHLLTNATCIETSCWTNGLLYDTGFGYPAMVPSLQHRTYVELYVVTESEIKLLDELEDYKENGDNNLYNRVKQLIYTDNNSTYAYVYIANQDNLLERKVPFGDWKAYRTNNCKKL
ncbi:gamma-glutamylcyclotransferase family protein [Lysinibacillus telephonicus]|uniref:Gamma-glutamylcyclotransferase n=1 Tax=Lysinibacillus telephonicus TaxID=1714840 RepID=A0A3S0JU94_9BACI|nr:gamma-glutamylcyclotransferase family protein [Lysinibacillus telephonicus]RTQ96085.1 gamma-glutamylcyclotransferase [Lysinibacillus telephonicus]